MQNREIIRAPISVFAKFCAEDDERKQRMLVRRAKIQSRKGGGDPYGSFKRIVRTARHQDQDIDSVQAELKALMQSKERLALLSDAFIGQWRKHSYNFFKVQPIFVSLARLTIKVAPDLGVLTRAGDEIAVRLWVSEGNILDRERDTFIYLMSEAKKPAQWPLHWRFGVWELEQERIHHMITVTDEQRKLTHERAEMFAEMSEALSNK